MKSPEDTKQGNLTPKQGATAGLVRSFEFDKRRPPEVDAGFAAAEGEGDGTLEYWRKVHWEYFGKECVRIGRVASLAVPVLCEQFKVVDSGQLEPAA